MTIRSLLFVGLCFSQPLFAEAPAASTEAVTNFAQKFLQILDEEQKAKATFTLENPERENWHYVPLEREGLRLDAMNQKQKDAAHELLGQSLSKQGHLTTNDLSLIHI